MRSWKDWRAGGGSEAEEEAEEEASERISLLPLSLLFH